MVQVNSKFYTWDPMYNTDSATCCCTTWNVQDRSCRPSWSHWSKCARYCTVTRFSLVKEVTGKDLTTNCSHAMKKNRNRFQWSSLWKFLFQFMEREQTRSKLTKRITRHPLEYDSIICKENCSLSWQERGASQWTTSALLTSIRQQVYP